MTFSIFLVDKKYLTFSIFLVVGVCGNLATCVVIVSNEYLRSESPPKVQYSTEPDFPKNTVNSSVDIIYPSHCDIKVKHMDKEK